jgi:hypothetical protein
MAGSGQIIILNGAPRSGKSSIVAAIQESFEGVWTNLGVDSYAQIRRRGTVPELVCGQAANAPISNCWCLNSTRLFTNRSPPTAGWG